MPKSSARSPGQLTESGIAKVQITYEGHVAEMKIKALTSAVLSGLLRPMLGDVNVVSAPVVAKERGMVVDEVVRAAQSDYESLITVTVTTERQERRCRARSMPTASRGWSTSRVSGSMPNSESR